MGHGEVRTMGKEIAILTDLSAQKRQWSEGGPPDSWILLRHAKVELLDSQIVVPPFSNCHRAVRNVSLPVEKGVQVGDESSTYLPAALDPSRLGTRGCVRALYQLVSEVAFTNPGFPSPLPGGARLLPLYC